MATIDDLLRSKRKLLARLGEDPFFPGSVLGKSPFREDRRPYLRCCKAAAAGTQPADIAIIGLACRFPGADNAAAFFELLCSGKTLFEPQVRDRIALPPWQNFSPQDPNYVPVKPSIAAPLAFDAAFFGYSEEEASWMDPQQRWFLTCAWEAFEEAGHDPRSFPGKVAVFGGTSKNTFLPLLLGARSFDNPIDLFRAQTTGNMVDHCTTRVAYKLGLTGPAVTVQTACSTSFTAIHLACEYLRHCQGDLALAGGVCLSFPTEAGYLYQDGFIESRTGNCRAFSAASDGTVFGDGVGVVLLRRLEDALAAGDHVHAILRGTAINNDGGDKLGYTSPGLRGQSEVLEECFARSGLSPAQVGYIETHGTGTAFGDRIEFAALRKVFSQHTERTSFCALGSVKNNIGHLDAAAGIAGLIKVVKALEHRLIPPLVEVGEPNPALDLGHSAFYLPAEVRQFVPIEGRYLAGISSFGVGGTNTHLLLERHEADPLPPEETSERLFPLSARTPGQLRNLAAGLATHLRANPVRPEDLALTLQTGRAQLRHRLILTGSTLPQVLAGLEAFLGDTPLPSGCCTSAEDEATQRLRLNLPEEIPSLTEALEGHALAALAWHWLRGATVAWYSLPSSGARRLSLPTYPFEPKVLWPHEIDDFLGTRPYPMEFLEPATVLSREDLPTGQRYKVQLDPSHPLLSDHRVQGTIVLPGAGFIDLALFLAAEATPGIEVGALENIGFQAPFRLLPGLPGVLEADLEPLDQVHTRLTFSSVDQHGNRLIHAACSLLHAPPAACPNLPTETSPVEVRSAKDVYVRFAALGLELGPTYRTLREVRFGRESLGASVVLQPGTKPLPLAGRLHPALLDGALQAALCHILDHREGLHLPFHCRRLDLFGPLGEAVEVVLLPRTLGRSGKIISHDLVLRTPGGSLVAGLQEFSVRALPTARPEEPKSDQEVQLFRPTWREAPALLERRPSPLPRLILLEAGPERRPWPAAPEAGLTHLSLLPGTEFRIGARGSWTLDPLLEEHWIEVFDRVAHEAAPPSVLVALLGLRSTSEDLPFSPLRAMHALLRCALGRPGSPFKRIVYLAGSTGGLVEPEDGAVRSFLRAVNRESARLKTCFLELEGPLPGSGELAALVAAELSRDDLQDEVRYVLA